MCGRHRSVTETKAKVICENLGIFLNLPVHTLRVHDGQVDVNAACSRWKIDGNQTDEYLIGSVSRLICDEKENADKVSNVPN